jgi:hypothetical protein
MEHALSDNAAATKNRIFGPIFPPKRLIFLVKAPTSAGIKRQVAAAWQGFLWKKIHFAGELIELTS